MGASSHSIPALNWAPVWALTFGCFLEQIAQTSCGSPIPGSFCDSREQQGSLHISFGWKAPVKRAFPKNRNILGAPNLPGQAGWGSPHPASWEVLGHVVCAQSEIQHLQLTFRRCQTCKECLLSVLDQFLTFPKCVYLCCPGWFARALLLTWFSSLIQLQVIKKKKQQAPSSPNT